jgi:diphosphomevalonate decarboxylase
MPRFSFVLSASFSFALAHCFKICCPPSCYRGLLLTRSTLQHSHGLLPQSSVSLLDSFVLSTHPEREKNKTKNSSSKAMATRDDKIVMATVSAPTNIAVIKYWGKADAAYNTPINSSLSVTLDQGDMRAVTTAAVSAAFEKDRLWLNGHEVPDAAESKRFRACVDGVKLLASDKMDSDGSVVVRRDQWQHLKIHVSSYNTFPTAAGLASSAAGYAALVAALAELMNAKEDFPNQLSTIARQGSGSACRSLYGGFVAWRMGSADNGWLDSKAEQIANETHWPEMRALILVVSDQKKDTSSTAGMSTSVASSPLLKHRAECVVPERMVEMEKAWLEKDFEGFGKLTMRDSNQFHATCLDTYPPIFYLNDVSRSVIRLTTVYNNWAREIRAAYTFDAGPNAVLFVLVKHATEVAALMLHYFPTTGPAYYQSDFLKEAESFDLDSRLLELCDETGRVPNAGDVKMIYFTETGPGPQVLAESERNLDPSTGLNTYEP